MPLAFKYSVFQGLPCSVSPLNLGHVSYGVLRVPGSKFGWLPLKLNTVCPQRMHHISKLLFHDESMERRVYCTPVTETRTQTLNSASSS